MARDAAPTHGSAILSLPLLPSSSLFVGVSVLSMFFVLGGFPSEALAEAKSPGIGVNKATTTKPVGRNHPQRSEAEVTTTQPRASLVQRSHPSPFAAVPSARGVLAGTPSAGRGSAAR